MLRDSSKTRGGVSVLLVITIVCLLALWALLWLAIMAGMGQFRNCYTRLRASRDNVIWLQFKGNRMRMAPSAEELEQAAWIEATHRGWDRTEFPSVEIPASGGKPDEASGETEVYFTLLGERCAAEWLLEQIDDAGVLWEFRISSHLETSRSLDWAPSNEPPTMGNPTLEVDAQPTGESGELAIEVALLLHCDHFGSLDILRNGRAVDAHLRVLDGDGKVVASETAPLEDFGYT